MTIYSIIEIVSLIVLSISIFIGFGVCYFVITPLLLKKHRGKSFFEAAIYEGLSAEFNLKKLNNETSDSVVIKTIAAIKYSKIIIVLSLLSLITFFVIDTI